MAKYIACPLTLSLGLIIDMVACLLPWEGISISCSESTNAPLMLHNSDVAVAISYSRSWACLQAKVMAHACMCAHALGSWACDLDI